MLDIDLRWENGSTSLSNAWDLHGLGGVWLVFSNNHFQFLNNILRIFIHFSPTRISINIFKQ